MAKPSAKTEYNLSFPALAGGLNIWDLDYRLSTDESPEMKNLQWRDGVLCSRDGQEWAEFDEKGNGIPRGEGFATYPKFWHNSIFAHIGDSIYRYWYDKEQTVPDLISSEQLGTGVPLIKGTFFLFNGKLYYKTVGCYKVIEYDDKTGLFSCTDVSGYVPIIYLNASPVNGSGDSYQPENRMSSEKTIWYNAEDTLTAVPSREDIAVSIEETSFKRQIKADGRYVFTYNSGWKYNGSAVDMLDYGMKVGGAVQNGDTITVTLVTTSAYHLPVKDIDSITKIEIDDENLKKKVLHESSFRVTTEDDISVKVVDGKKWETKFPSAESSETFSYLRSYTSGLLTWHNESGEEVELADYGLRVLSEEIADGTEFTVNHTRGDFSVDEVNGIVYFNTVPPVLYPEVNNTVRITFSKENAEAMANIMDCRYAITHGGTGGLCVVMAGSKTQPNAYFWCGQTAVEVDASYFPFGQYQIAGDISDPITGFGKQQSYLVIFQENSVGRSTMTTTEMDGRTTLDFPYVPINALIGCDLPWTIRLIENNLVWCNTEQGVHVLKDSSSAYENNIICISTKVNGSISANGMLNDIRAVPPDLVCTLDDERHYWLTANGRTWYWDYNISEYKDPSWFLFDNIDARAYVSELDDKWHIDSKGRITKFVNCFMDYKQAIDKVYEFAVQFFGTYDVLKNVNSVIINTRSDTNSVTTLEYITDYEHRMDLTPLSSKVWRLWPRDLSIRRLQGRGFANTFRRRPMCRRVRHFTMKLRNANAGEDLSIVSAQIFYNYQGKFR